MFCCCVRCVQVDEATGAVRAMRRLGGDGGAGADDDEGPGRVMLTARSWVVPAPAADAVRGEVVRVARSAWRSMVLSSERGEASIGLSWKSHGSIPRRGDDMALRIVLVGLMGSFRGVLGRGWRRMDNARRGERR